jgi:hypothetical protein
LKGLSRVTGNYHARFLGGLGPAMAPGYPVVADLWFSDKIPVQHIFCINLDLKTSCGYNNFLILNIYLTNLTSN